MIRTDIDVARNGDFIRELRVTDTAGDGIDITGAVLSCQIRDTAEGSLIATGEIDVVEPLDGRFNLTIRGDDFDTFGRREVINRAAYDVRMLLSGTYTIILVGAVNVLPGSTY